MSDKLKNALIGLFIIIALASSIYMVLFLEPQIGDGKKILRVRFSNVASINVGTQVTLAGKPVGEVIKIDEVKGAREDHTDELGRVYFFQLTLKVDSSVEIYNTDEVTIATTGLLGEKSIAIIPKAAVKGVPPKNITDQIIYAQSVEPLENIVHQISSLSERMESTIGDLDVWFVENQDELSTAVKNFGAALGQIEQMIDSVNKEKIIDSVKEAIADFSVNMKMIQASIAEFQDNEMLAKFNTILENFETASKYISTDGVELLSNMNKISQDIVSGQGTLGKFIKNDDFYLRLTTILSKVDTLMNDINHYGVLFQYDKKWQRIRTKRANLLEALQTPKEFKSYFEGEVDTITTALERISVLMDRAEEKDKLMSSGPFQKDFADLLRQVEHLLDSLKLYNEQLVETIENENCN